MSSAFTGGPTNYRVTATSTQAGNWGAVAPSNVPLLVISTKTATRFVISSFNLQGTALNAPAGGVTIDWQALAHNP